MQPTKLATINVSRTCHAIVAMSLRRVHARSQAGSRVVPPCRITSSLSSLRSRKVSHEGDSAFHNHSLDPQAAWELFVSLDAGVDPSSRVFVSSSQYRFCGNNHLDSIPALRKKNSAPAFRGLASPFPLHAIGRDIGRALATVSVGRPEIRSLKVASVEDLARLPKEKMSSGKERRSQA